MSVTVTVSCQDSNKAFAANGKAVDLGHFWARTFFEELDLEIDPDSFGMIGNYPLGDFTFRCAVYEGQSKAYAERLVALCKAGYKEGATLVSWA